MTYHYGNNEYYHLVGRVLVNEYGVCRVIQGLQEEHDSVYRFTDGITGNAYRVYVMVAGSDEMESFHFRHFREVVAKYGELQPIKSNATLTTIANRIYTNVKMSPTIRSDTEENAKQLDSKIKKWAKIHPEK